MAATEDTPVGYFVVWDGNDHLEYYPGTDPPYTRTVDVPRGQVDVVSGITLDGPPLWRRYGPAELQELCPNASDVGVQTVAGREATHYACGGEWKEIWLDASTGWMLKTRRSGLTVTATQIDFDPTIDEDTFSTSIPAGEEGVVTTHAPEPPPTVTWAPAG